MAFLPIAHVAINYSEYDGWWIKAYEVGTTTPKSMALKSDGTSQVAKLELNVDGFVVTSGAALVIPYVSGLFDMWMFPTEAEADANDTINALRIADGSQGDGGSAISDIVTLIAGQTTVALPSVTAETAIIYIQGQDVDQGKLLNPIDYTVTDGSTIELTRSYPAGSIISALGFTEIESGEVISVFTRTGAVAAASGDYTASQVTNTPAGNVSSTDVQGAINELEALHSWEDPDIADFTAVAKESYQIDASANTVDITLPVLAIGDPFVFHNLITSTFKVQVLNPIETIKGKGGDIAAATNMEIEPGQSVQLVTKTTTILSIVGVLV